MVIEKSGFFSSSYRCDWCNKEFSAIDEANSHEMKCDRAPPHPYNDIECYTSHNEFIRFFSRKDIRKNLATPEFTTEGQFWVISKKTQEPKPMHIQWHNANAIEYWENEQLIKEIENINLTKSIELAEKWIENLGLSKKEMAKKHERLLEFKEAAEIYKELELEEEVIRVRKLLAEQGAVKVAQKVVHGDEVTEIKDSVLNRSNVGGGSSKMQELEKLAEMKKEGLIDDDEFKQMKKEVLGK